MLLGSLFDGSGGFPLAGMINGISPVWASEIEPFPIRVTKLRIPQMKHLGSVTEINGAEIEPVDIITFGSPCQDLSIAGKQAGIHEGKRSNLFFEAVRIIREMREHDRANGRADFDIRPRYAVWENVPGAFSSNKGKDFRAVIQALCEVRGGQDHIVPMPPKGKWNTAGCVVGDGWSLAWRVYDAQFWGVPQRRKRIYLIADFGSERAGEILFERESVRGDSAEGRETGKGTSGDAERSAGGSNSNVVICKEREGTGRGGKGLLNNERYTYSHTTLPDNIVICPAAFMGGQGAKARGIAYCADGTTPTLKSALSGGNTVPDVVYLCYDSRGNGDGKTAPTITGDHKNRVTDYTALAMCCGNGQMHQTNLTDKAGALNCMHDAQAVLTNGKPPRKYIVRRLTPTECARLQGFPDWWCDGANGSDSAQYKMWGNGIALPCAVDVLGRIAKGAEHENAGAD